ncbi:uncharacterized protein LOC116196020 isoform X2 [Punica granatum]|nr:uncharacterized protein LOC116196020 isoform X2 [Punica granatum]
MGKIWVEVSLISARGLRRSSLWKVQWFAVGWIDPKNKYCTRIDASGSSNPQWKTKFATLIDTSGSGYGDLALHIEVYSREPIFLRESLHGTATIFLKEFFLKHSKGESVSRRAIDEVASYQLRKGNSNKPQGFIDISVRISEEGEVPSSYSGNGGGIVLMAHNHHTTSAKDEDSSDDISSPQAPPTHLPIIRRAQENRTRTEFPHDSSDDLPSSQAPLTPPQIIRRARENRTRAEFPHSQSGGSTYSSIAGMTRPPIGGHLPR